MLKYIFFTITIIHGLIHFLGFSKAFSFGHLNILVKEISKPAGVLWLFTGALFIFCLLFYFLKRDYWHFIGILAVFFSQILIFDSWAEAKYGTIANAIILVVSIIGIFQTQFKNSFKQEVKTSLEQSSYAPESNLNEADIKSLPNIVQNYLRYTGCIGKPKVNNFAINFSGKIRSKNESFWMELNSEQYNFLKIPTRLFFMNAIMKQLPVAGFHCFKNGVAHMDIRLISLFKVQYQKGYEMDISETTAFFNDMCCLAPASLIDKNITWGEVSNNSVKATFTSNGKTISACLYFNEKGELVNFVSEDRYAAEKNGAMTKLKWSTPLSDYRDVNGHKLATYAEAIYTYPDREFTYASFSLEKLAYNLKRGMTS